MSNPSAAGQMTRPTLIPGLRRLWRGRHRLQLGVAPARAVIVELPDPGAAEVLDLLDGTRSVRTALTQARRRGVREADAQALFEQLCRAGLVISSQALMPTGIAEPRRGRLLPEAAALALRPAGPGEPAQILRRRDAARVMISGNGPLVAPMAVALAASGVGHVALDLTDPAEQRRVAALVAEHAPGTRTTPLRLSEVTFVVQVGEHAPAVLVAERLAGRGLAYLAISVRDGTAIVGPLVPPAGSPCLNCIDLHRTDRDPEWPALAAQLATDPRPPVCAAVTTLIAAGVAAGEVLRWLDGVTPDTHGATLDITTGSRPRRRSWPPHPECGCGRRPQRRDEAYRPATAPTRSRRAAPV